MTCHRLAVVQTRSTPSPPVIVVDHPVSVLGSSDVKPLQTSFETKCLHCGVGNSGGGRRGTRSACAGPGRGGRCERVRPCSVCRVRARVRTGRPGRRARAGWEQVRRPRRACARVCGA